jgi:hypothetical protein
MVSTLIDTFAFDILFFGWFDLVWSRRIVTNSHITTHQPIPYHLTNAA